MSKQLRPTIRQKSVKIFPQIKINFKSKEHDCELVLITPIGVCIAMPAKTMDMGILGLLGMQPG